MEETLSFGLGGIIHRVDHLSPTTTLLDYIRENARLLGTKEGCNEGDCGACTVVLASKSTEGVRYEPVNSCITFLGMVHGKVVLTIEDLSDGDDLHPIQAAMVDHHGSQCGFCTPGIVMSLFAHETTKRSADRDSFNDCLAGNLCRCTGYRPIIDAALAARDQSLPTPLSKKLESRLALLDQLDQSGGILSKGEDQSEENGSFFASPTRLEEALRLLNDHPDATLVSGATDVGLWVTKGMRNLSKLICLNRIESLKSVSEEADQIVIGGMASYEETHGVISSLDPDFGELWRRIGSMQIRTTGTIGGNIANGSPIGDTPPVLIALNAEISVSSLGGERNIPLEEFFIEYGKQDRQQSEILTKITVPKPSYSTFLRCYKISKRFDEDITTVLGAFAFELSPDGLIEAARAVYGGMAGIPKRAAKLERLIVGQPVEDLLSGTEIEAAIDRDFQPLSDVRASAEYRSRVAANLCRKALMELNSPEIVTRVQPRAEVVQAHA